MGVLLERDQRRGEDRCDAQTNDVEGPTASNGESSVQVEEQARPSATRATDKDDFIASVIAKSTPYRSSGGIGEKARKPCPRITRREIDVMEIDGKAGEQQSVVSRAAGKKSSRWSRKHQPSFSPAT